MYTGQPLLPEKRKIAPHPDSGMRRRLFWETQALFAEVGDAECSGRLLFAVVAQTAEDEHEHRDDVRQDLVDLRGNERNAQAQVQVLQAAEQDAAPDGCGRLPKAEDDERDSQPADTGQALVVPHAACDASDIGDAADGGDAAAQHGGQIFIAGDVDTGSVCRCGDSPTARRYRPLRVLFRNHARKTASARAKYVRMLCWNSSGPSTGMLRRKAGKGEFTKIALRLLLRET